MTAPSAASDPAHGSAWPAVAVAAVWGVNVPLMKAGLEELDPLVFNAARLTLSALALGIADRIENGPLRARDVPWRTIVWFGLLSSFAYQVLFLMGMDATAASDSALIIASGPLWTALIAWFVGVERPGRGSLVSLAVAFLGALLVTVSGASDDGPSSLIGNVLVLLAMVTWAAATVASRPILESFPATRLAFLATVVSLPLHWCVATPRLADVGTERPGLVAVSLTFSGLLSTGLAYAWWNRSVRTIGPARTATYSYLVPVVSIAVAWSWLGDRPDGWQALGGALVIAGLASRGRRPRR